MNALTLTSDQRRGDIAQATGESKYGIREVRVDIGRLLNDGILVDIDLHGFGCLKAGVSWKELGINDTDERRQRVTKGQKVLVPLKWANALKSLEVRFRQSVQRYSFEIGIFRPWFWVPLTAWESWKTEWEALQKQLMAFRESLKAELPDIVDENRTYFKAVARRAWRAYDTTNENAVVMTPEGKVFAGYQAFEDGIVNEALAQVPTDADIDAIFATYRTGFALLPPEIADSYAKASAETRIENAKAREAEAFAARAEAAADKARQEAMFAEASRDAKLAAIRQAEYERARKELENTISPLTEVMLKFRDQVYEDVVAISESVKKNGALVGRTSQKARGLKDLYDLMASCTNDDALRVALKNLEASLSTAPSNGSRYNIGAVEQALSDVVALTKGSADELRRLGCFSSRSDKLEL